MLILDKPKVVLVAKTIINSYELNRLLESPEILNYTKTSTWEETADVVQEDLDLLPEFGGRLCYKSFGTKQGKKSNREYLDNVMSLGHGSVLEHSNMSFYVLTTRNCTHELVRHRAGFAFSQESTRYVKYDDSNSTFIINKFSEKTSQYQQVITGALHSALERGRDHYPGCLAASILVTVNLRALRHFLALRGTRHADWAIREVALQMYEFAKLEAPNVFQDFELVEFKGHKDKYLGLIDGVELVCKYQKV